MPESGRLAGRLVPGLVLGLAVALAGCGDGTDGPDPVVRGGVVDDGDSLNGAVLTQPYAVPSVTLTDTTDQDFDLRARATKPLTMVFFGYTHCPDICIAVMADVASTLNRLSADEAAQVDVVFVTTDPARDDPATIRTWLDRFNPEFEGVTGPLPGVRRLATAMHVPIEAGKKLPSGGYEVTHGTPVLGVVPGGEVRAVWTEGTSAAKYTEDVRAVLHDPSVLEG